MIEDRNSFVDKSDNVDSIKQLFIGQALRLIVVDADIEHILGSIHPNYISGFQYKLQYEDIDFIPRCHECPRPHV